MPTQTVKYVVTGEDKASKVFQNVGNSAEAAHGKLGKLQGGLEKTGSVLGKVGLGAGLGLGALVSKGFADAIDANAANKKLKAQLGLTGKQAAAAGKAAGKLFSGNMAGDFGEANEAIKSVVSNIDGMRGASTKSLTDISGKVLNLSHTFDQDLGGTTAAVSQLMRTGLAKNANQALDIITKGFQGGANKADDLLDTFNEYGTQFRKLGLSGAQMTGILQQGLKGGARDADLVADAMKEFSIRAVDGSTTTAQGFKQLGLNGKQMAETIAKGGPKASQALDTVLDRLRGIKDPVKQSQAAVNLFGTQAEDLGKALYSIDPSKATQSLGKVGGAADQLGKDINSGPKAKLSNFIREMQGGLINVIGTKVIPAVQKLVTWVDKNRDTFVGIANTAKKILTPVLMTVWHSFQTLFNFLAKHQTTAKILAIGIAGIAAAIGLVNLAMSIGPIGIFTAALVGLALVAALIIKHWKGIAGFFSSAFTAIKGPAMAVVNWFRGTFVNFFTEDIPAAFHAFIGFFTTTIPNAFRTVIDFVKKHWRGITQIILAPIIGLPVLIWKFWGPIKNTVIRIVDGIVGFFTRLPGRIARGLNALGSAIATPFVAGYKWSTKQITNGIDAIVGWFTKLPGRIGRGLSRLGSFIKNSFVNAYTFYKGWITDRIGWVVGFFTAMPGRIGRGLRSIGSTIATGFKNAYNYAKGWITDRVDWIVGFFAKLPGRIGTAMKNIGDAISSPFAGAFNFLKQHIIGPFLKTVGRLPGLGFLKDIGNAMTGDGGSSKPPVTAGVAQSNGNHGANVLQHRAKGGPVLPGQMAWVGEAGKELMQALPGGGVMIYPHGRSMQMADNKSGLPGYSFGGFFGSIGKAARWASGTAIGAAMRGAEKVALGGIGLIPGGGWANKFAKGFMDRAVNTIEDWIKGKQPKNKSGGGTGDMSAHSASAAAAQTYARSLLGEFGWGSGQMGSLISLWNGESGWNNMAQNPTSTAFGIAQFLDSTWAGKRYPKTTNYQQQIYDGLQYIQGSYGTPANALGAWLSRSPHWYDQGGKLRPGLTLAYNGTGRDETIRTASQEAALRQPVIVKVFIGDEEITDRIDVRVGSAIRRHDTQQLRRSSRG